MIYGYARVSTRGQASHGNSLEEQRMRLEEAGCTEFFTDVFTGKTTDRPALRSLLESVAEGDMVVVTKLDRLARTAVEGCTVVRDLIARGVSVRVLNMGLIEDTPVGRMLVTVMFAMAEMERDLILERTRAGYEYAKANDPSFRAGRPPADVDMETLLSVMADHDAGVITAMQAADALGVGKTTYYKLRKAAS